MTSISVFHLSLYALTMNFMLIYQRHSFILILVLSILLIESVNCILSLRYNNDEEEYTIYTNAVYFNSLSPSISFHYSLDDLVKY